MPPGAAANATAYCGRVILPGCLAVKEWGYDYLMFDFVSADFENDHDDTRTMSQAIRDRFQRIREAVGAEVFIEACMVMPGPVLGIADGFRPAFDWRAGMEPELVSQFASRFYYHSRLFQLDLEFFHPSITPFTWEGQGPDKGRRFFGSIERVKTWASFSGICGYSYLTGGVIEQVSAERWRLFTRAMPVYGRAGRPHQVIGLFNWGTEAQEKVELDLTECGLDVTKRYVIFDFWAGKLLGLYGSQYETTLPPGGCQVLFVHEVSPDPIVIGTDRHVTGAIGIRNFGYDVHASEIIGTSEGPAGSCVAHFIYVPSGQGPSSCEGAVCEVSQPCVLRVDVKLPESEGRSTSVQTWKVKLAADRVSI